MAKNKISLKQFEKYISNIKKYRDSIKKTNKKLITTITNMNKSVYYGGNTANEWYRKADASVTSNEKFLEKLELNIAKLEKRYKELYEIAHTPAPVVAHSSSGIPAAIAALMNNPNASSTTAAVTAGGTGAVAGATVGSLSPQETQMLYALVYAEASENPAYVSGDSAGVASVVYNRLASGNYGNSISSVITAPGQFSGYNNSKYNAYMNNPNLMSPEMKAAIDSVAAGNITTSAQYFNGNGKYNTFH